MSGMARCLRCGKRLPHDQFPAVYRDNGDPAYCFGCQGRSEEMRKRCAAKKRKEKKE